MFLSVHKGSPFSTSAGLARPELCISIFPLALLGFGVESLRGAPLSILSFPSAAFFSFSQGGVIR